MGSATKFSEYLKRMELSEPNGWGQDEFHVVQTIILQD